MSERFEDSYSLNLVWSLFYKAGSMKDNKVWVLFFNFWERLGYHNAQAQLELAGIMAAILKPDG